MLQDLGGRGGGGGGRVLISGQYLDSRLKLHESQLEGVVILKTRQ